MRFLLKTKPFLNKNYANVFCTKRSHYQASTVDAEDVKRHSYLAAEWWNPNGPMKALHSMNQIRVPFIRDGLIATNMTNQENVNSSKPLEGVQILEVGCGAGLLTEQLARIHANVVAIDPGKEVINMAQQHLLKYSNTNDKFTKRIIYKNETIENHLLELKLNRKYDAVVVSEVLEHVNDKVEFLKACTDALKPGGSIFLTTFNKTYLSWFGGIIMAEEVLKLVPKETHDWNKFISPLDTQRILDQCGCTTIIVNGFMYEFWRNKWQWINSKKISYALQAIKV